MCKALAAIPTQRETYGKHDRFRVVSSANERFVGAEAPIVSVDLYADLVTLRLAGGNDVEFRRDQLQRVQ